eukprot:TRINITY_DN39828_c0_g1_i1.p1 TRINITY_DN39828_c0_g1~~TRINITY_DN39828_c0_g1_i1.p1  ORF type:complete len:151 (-),score=4.77 TRINITY_DN39828_c0_g1_i1:198-650(-)
MFARLRSQRGSSDNRMLHWVGNAQSSNSSRSFEIVDRNGVQRYHCKPCHMYYLSKCFSRTAITNKTHMCELCMSALEHGKQTGRHCHKTPFHEWPDAAEEDTGLSQVQHGPWTITTGTGGCKPPWVADEPRCNAYSRTSASYGSHTRHVF